MLLTVSIGAGETTWVKWLSLIMFVISLFLASVKYTLTINEKTIVYSVHLFGITIYKKQATSSDIKKIVFKRANWTSKLAVIKTNKDSIRIVLFTPVHVYDDLFVFYERNAIAYEKTKDYLILEKMI